LNEALHGREQGAGGRAVHVAYDLWADWYEYAFPNLLELFTDYPGALREDPRTYLPAVMRDIFGNPFRPAPAVGPAWLAWQAGAVPRLARAAYDGGRLPEGTLDPARLAVLADALEDAGCADPELLGHLRGPGPHVRGCWAVDLILGKG
jgi:hypothetical protein